MVRATYKLPSGTVVNVDVPVRACADLFLTDEHARRVGSGEALVTCEQVNDSGRVTNESVPFAPPVDPASGDPPDYRGVTVASLKKRAL